MFIYIEYKYIYKILESAYIQESKTGRPEVQGQPGLYSEIKHLHTSTTLSIFYKLEYSEIVSL